MIKRRDFLKFTTALTARISVLPRTPFFSSSKTEPPNILIIQSDQHRGTIMSCAGDDQAKTPNFDQFAAEGIRFSNCASITPVCSPSRATLQTGLFSHTHRVDQNNIALDPDFTTIAEILSKAGYVTGYIGKWHLSGSNPTDVPGGFIIPGKHRQGWQEWNGYEKGHEYFKVWKYNEKGEKVRVKGYNWEPSWQTDMALSFAKKNRDTGKPWCYYISFGPPHFPHQCPEKFMNMYNPRQFILPPDIEKKFSPERKHELRKILQVYYAQVTAIDFEIGRIIKGLKDLGIDKNTIILYTSDHGDYLGRFAHFNQDKLRGKGMPFETVFRIPLIIRWPKKIKPLVCDTLISNVDIAATILDLAGLQVPKQMQGDSMASWCLYGKGPRKEAVYLELGGLNTNRLWWRAAWDGRYVYSVYSDVARRIIGNNNNELLLDYNRDPYETKNFSQHPSYKSVKQKMSKILIQLAEQTQDPIITKIKKIAAN